MHKRKRGNLQENPLGSEKPVMIGKCREWTEEEDSIIIDAKQNNKGWKDIPQRLPGRKLQAVCKRWTCILNPILNHAPFSKEEDLLLWKAHQELGNEWVKISSKFFDSKRPQDELCMRWHSKTFQKFVSDEFGCDADSGEKSKGKDCKASF